MGEACRRRKELNRRMTEDFVIKYLWSAAGYGLMSIPILFPGPAKRHSTTIQDQVAHRTEGGWSFTQQKADEQDMSRIDVYCFP